MVFVLVAIGAIVGLGIDEGTGALLGATIGWLVARTVRQQRAIEALQRRLGETAAAAGAAAAPAAQRTAAAAPVQESGAADGTSGPIMPEAPAHPEAAPALAAADQPEAAGAQPPSAGVSVAGAPVAFPLPASPAPAASAAPPSPRGPGPVDALRGWLFGGNTIVKAGVGILFIGLAFLAKYASEHVHVPVELRLAAIALAAIALTVVGWRLRHTRAEYAQVLQGGGIAVLYLTLFVAFRWYGVIAVAPTFALMAVVAALAAALAVLQEAPALAVVGTLGGFAAPLLVSTGGGSHVALFSYYLVLDLGIAAVAWVRTWRALNGLGFGFTYAVGCAWGITSYEPAHYASAQTFVVLFFLVFIAVLLLPARRVATGDEAPPHRADRWVNGSLLFGLPMLTFALQYGLVRDTRFGAAVSALLLAAFYVGLAAALRARPRLALAFEGSLAIGTVFLTLVIPFALEPGSTAGAWALEAAGLVWLGFRQRRWLARAFGYALLAIAGLMLLHAVDTGGPPERWLNPLLTSSLLLAAGALAAARTVALHAAPAPGATGYDRFAGEAIVEPLLVGWALLAALGGLVLHVEPLVDADDRIAAMVAGTALIALLHTLLAARLDWRGAAWPVLGFAPLLLAATGASALFQDNPMRHHGWWAWPLALAVHATSLRLAAPHWPARAAHVAHAAGALVFAALGALLGRALTRNLGDLGSAWPWLGWLAVPALLLAVLPRRDFAATWPASADPPAYQRSAGAMLTVGLLLWTLAANVVSNGAAQPLSYLPVVNPLDLGVALALFAAWRWIASDAGRDVFARHPRTAPALLGGAGFVWLNAMLVRAFHHHGDVPFRFAAWVDSLAVQTGLTLLWTTTALVLMWISARRALRAPWMAGAALLALVVLKLLLVDLSGSGTVTRIVSFIGAGLLMLVIGYVAPLPGREKHHG